MAKSGCPTWDKLIRHLCKDATLDGEKIDTKFLSEWMMSAYLFPHERNGNVVLYGPQDSGKGSLTLMMDVLTNNVVRHCEDGSSWNGHLLLATIVSYSEMKLGHASKIRRYLCDDRIGIHRSMRMYRSIPNRTHWILEQLDEPDFQHYGRIIVIKTKRLKKIDTDLRQKLAAERGFFINSVRI